MFCDKFHLCTFKAVTVIQNYKLELAHWLLLTVVTHTITQLLKVHKELPIFKIIHETQC